MGELNRIKHRRRPKKFNNIELTSKKKKKRESNTMIYHHLHATIILNPPPLVHANWRGMNYKWQNILLNK